VKAPPVVFDRVITTLVAFTWSASAIEPDAIVSVVAGEEREIIVGATYVSGAARTTHGSAAPASMTRIRETLSGMCFTNRRDCLDFIGLANNSKRRVGIKPLR
jgi:hypothetical protein